MEKFLSFLYIGDYSDDSKNPKKLLGFGEDLSFAQMGGGVIHRFDRLCDIQKLSGYIKKLNVKMSSCKTHHPSHLLGFQSDSVQLDTGEMVNLNCICCNIIWYLLIINFRVLIFHNFLLTIQNSNAESYICNYKHEY